MIRTPIILLFLSWILAYLVSLSNGESSTCLMVYKEGGAPAVFQSPKCPLWRLSDHASGRRTATCQSAISQGRRKSQEDRTFCALDVRIPFHGLTGLAEVVVGIVAIFDGHNGAEASEMASKLLFEYFILHTYFLLDATYSAVLKKSTGRLPNKEKQDIVFQVLHWDDELGRHRQGLERFMFTIPAKYDSNFHLEILKESLLRTIHDIDNTFSKEASRNNLDSGSTATVVLIADGQILVANVGDSKALLCSEKFQSPAEAKVTLSRLYRMRRRSGTISALKHYDRSKSLSPDRLAHFSVKELTRDHHPDRDDEKSRVESAGGYVHEWGGVARVNGQLAVSRAIGDLSFKSYGVIPTPEVTDWQPLTTNDSYLVAASDGIFEKLSSQEVCDILWENHVHPNMRSGFSSSCSYSLAECIVDTAFEKGSMDNMAVVVVPLRSTELSQTHRCDGAGDNECSALGPQSLIYKQPASVLTSKILHLEVAHPVMARFDRLLIEGKHSSFACFYLSENLKVDYIVGAQKDIEEGDMFDVPQALPEALGHQCGGPPNLYDGQSLCLHFGMTAGSFIDQCINPEGFAGFLALLESIPLHNSDTNYGSFEYSMPDLRYTLKKRFGHGSYGEVWLAFSWNCSQGADASKGSGTKKGFSFNMQLDSYKENSQTNSSSHNCHAGSSDDNLFILKRIMVHSLNNLVSFKQVERGTAAYLSGLREKYFGEIFLNASTCLGGSLSAEASSPLFSESDLNLYDLLEMNESVIKETVSTSNREEMVLNKFETGRVVHEEGLDHIARYIESFESQSNEIWLVFRHEGVSLSKLMYTVEEIEKDVDEGRDEKMNHIQVLHPSKWWHWLKTTEAGQEEMRNLIWQLLMALKSCHDRNITHRDIKPENMVICFKDHDTGRCMKGAPSEDKEYIAQMRIIDFGSAIDDFTLKHFYSSVGPSRAEQTYEYAPPEAFLNASWYKGSTRTTLKYDAWSVGVVFLELILGSPNVFQINARTRALLDKHLKGWNEELKELAYKLRSFMEMCILIPGDSSRHPHLGFTKGQGGASPASWKCSEEFFSHQIKSRDLLKLGFPNVWALRLVRQLLHWDPDERLSVDDALQHPYFQHPPPKR